VSARDRRTEHATVAFAGRGHPNVTATHDKTLELTRDVDITRRATCVVGVASAHDDGALRNLRGRVEIALESDGQRDDLTATISPFFLGDPSLVIRRGPGLRAHTFAFDASKTAADLDRALVTRIAAAEHDVDVTIRVLDPEATSGALFVVSLPIGNDADVSPRALEVLERVDLVLAEDTRRLHALEQRVGLKAARATSYHDHNEAERVDGVLEQLRRGARVALVSDAGTPLFSDPGYVVVSRAVAEGIAVSPVPGPSAALAVLAACGLPVDRFVFGGFLPRRSAQRRQAVTELTGLGAAVVCYESATRLAATLADVAAVRPDWQVCVGREVTKVFEEFRRGTADELARAYAPEKPLGECTLVIAPPLGARADAEAAGSSDDVDALLRSLLVQGVPASTLAQALRAIPGVSRNQAYARVLALGAETPRER
jgi:16S rRNA (cytidine1402-2'-O)-methyltransferase